MAPDHICVCLTFDMDLIRQPGRLATRLPCESAGHTPALLPLSPVVSPLEHRGGLLFAGAPHWQTWPQARSPDSQLKTV